MTVQIDRRQFLVSTATTSLGLVIGFHWPGVGRGGARAEANASFAPNAFLRIDPDDTVTVVAKHIEFGQGAHTGLATILCEELDASWSQIRVEEAPADGEKYRNLNFPGNHMGTGGSSAMANSWEQLRRAGAAGRAMLVAAAASEWGVPAGEVGVREGVVRHPSSGHEARFGALVTRAAALPVPSEVTLKDPGSFRLIGHDVPRLDARAKSTGQARFTLDVREAGLLTAVLARPPRFGGRVASVDDSEARKVSGVVDVVTVPRGVAVVAHGFWAARKGRDALRVEWDDSAAETRGSEELVKTFRDLARKPGTVVESRGDAASALAGAGEVVEAEFVFPFLAHAPMETLDCVARLEENRLDLKLGSQLPTLDQELAARAVGLPKERVFVETLFAGGSFGRRATPDSDVAVEAATVAKALGPGRTVKVVWTREDDIRGGRYRPLYVHQLRAALREDGRPLAWEHRIVGQSILAGTLFESALVRAGFDATAVEGARGLPYAVPNFRVEVHSPSVGVPPLWWRSVGHTHNGFSTEVIIDELAAAAGKDAIAYRLELLGDDRPRHRAVLRAVAGASGGLEAPQGRARGVALHESFGSVVSQVAEVSLRDDGLPRVHRVWCAVDCGIAINPDIVRAQMSGGLGFGLGAALHNEIVLEEGRVRQSNFHDYPLLSMSEMPEVEVTIVPSSAPPSGVGEPGTPPIAPAVANAMRRLTGRPVRRLPFRRHADESKRAGES